MMELWEQDFRREMLIWSYRVKDLTDKQIKELLKQLAEKQSSPEMTEDTMGWMDVAGVWHDNPNWKKFIKSALSAALKGGADKNGA